MLGAKQFSIEVERGSEQLFCLVVVALIAKYVQQLTRAAGSPIAGGDAVTGKERTA